MPNKIETIFITGLHRSGTTILNFILGAHSQCIAVGEVFNVIDVEQDRAWVEDHYNRCTCGHCEFWPEVMKNIDKDGTDSLQQRYEIFLRTFADHFSEKIPVDSSKDIACLQALTQTSTCRVVRIVRDVRGWCISQAGKITPRLMLSWYRKNIIFERYTKNAISVGYENLVLDSNNQVRKLCEYLKLMYEEQMIKLRQETQHILVGNRMRTAENLKITYDGRWMRSPSIWPILLYPIMIYNKKQVYN